jgi:pimeloyl-ACP methyl ester carboxylesterase
MKKTFLYFLIGFLILYLLACLNLYFAQTDILFPSQVANQTTYQEIADAYPNATNTYTAKDKTILQGFFVDSKPNLPLYIYYGGNAEDVAYTFPFLTSEMDRSLLSINYRGYGKSGGKPSESDLFSDALEIFDAYQVKFKDRPIILVGRSLGSGVACYVASHRNINGLVLLTPYDSILNVAKTKFPFMPIQLLLNHPFDSYQYSEKIKAPTLFCLAQSDFVVPNANSMHLYEHWVSQKKLVTIANSNHDNLIIQKEFINILNTFLLELENSVK